MKHRSLFFVLMLLLGSISATASDWVRDEGHYHAYSYSDHIKMELNIADLDYGNTYSAGGYVYATNGLQTVKLLYLKYINQGDDESQTAEVKAYLCETNAKAWFTNSQAGDQEIGTTEKSFWLTKEGSDYHYMVTKIDYYYPAELAGGKWKIYYKFTHSNGGEYTMTLNSSLDIMQQVALYDFATNTYTVERTSPSNIRFTVPKLPDDVPQKVNAVRMRTCSYNVEYVYTRQDGTTYVQRETFDCEKNQAKQYDTTIPGGIGNPRRIDINVEARQGVKDPERYFWEKTDRYSQKNIFKVVPMPNGAHVEYRQFDLAADLAWSQPQGANYMAVTPYIYRIETDQNGNVPSDVSWTKRGVIDVAGRTQFTDNNVAQAKYYRYRVVNVPTDWISNGINTAELSAPSADLLDRLGYGESNLLTTAPTMSIYALQQDTTVADKVRLTWQYSRVPTTSETVMFKVMRRETANDNWSEYGNVTGDANPKAGTLLMFEDSNLANPQVCYQYMVRLELTGGATRFDSDPVYAGLLKGTKITGFSATKGTHEGTVRLSWNANQVGTANSTYVLYRRYVNSDDDFMQIKTEAGTSGVYTYEDNTVQPGYYYEYRLEVYSGNALQNSMTDVGFCQARGVVSGRISFGTGTSVEDVRLTLRPSEATDDNTVRSYSQRVDGASTGIQWNAGEEEIQKIFGEGKDYTVQFFVRPDEGLSEGAVLGEIPGVGRLIAGEKTDGGYQLLCRQTAGLKTNKVYTQVNHFKGIYYCPALYKDSVIWNGETIYGSVPTNEIETQLIADGYQLSERNEYTAGKYNANNWVYLWLYHKFETLEAPIVYGYDLKASAGLYDLGISLPAGVYSLLTVKNQNGKQIFSIGDATSGGMTLLRLETSGDVLKSETVTPDCQMYNGYPVSFEGSYVKGLSSLLIPNTDNPVWAKYVKPVATSTQESTEAVPLYNEGTFSVGGAAIVSADKGFKGNITEVRVWDHALTETEQAAYADRVLNGREQGLRLYWPMDEGLDRYVFDASYANDMPNGRHATVGNNITASTIVPADDQLSRYTLTNKNGEYILRGIPFVGSGSTYTVLPTKGIHEFNPASRNGFIGSGSLTLNGYDFTDVSSFPVKGKVTYLNTNIPADSIMFKIDGAFVQSGSGAAVSDANGEYEISVPIGQHRIEAYRNGHRLTAFPMDGSTYDFRRAETVNFIDSTLVNVTGRINGGFSDQDEPLGFRRSTNRIGRAEIKLSLGKESQCSFNYIVNDHGEGAFGTENLPVASATDSIQSTAYRAGGEHDDTYYIYITTDERTGEFSAMLPPLKYKVESIRLKGGTQYDDEPVFAQNLPVIDATNTVKEKMQSDSLTLGEGSIIKYYYSAKMNRQLRVNPTINVRQNNLRSGVFGEKRVEIATGTLERDSIDVLTLGDDTYHYRFSHPIFVQDKTYGFEIDVAEHYKNQDTGLEACEVPRDAVIHISNDASSTTTVFAEKGKAGKEDIEMGMPYETHDVEITPNAKGHVDYEFVAGWPNFAAGHLLNMSVSVNIDGRVTMWKAPDSMGDALDLIVLGSIGTGTNFVTEGPDDVDMIIRRPPGSTSVASLTTKEIHSYTHSNFRSKTNVLGIGVYISETPTFELETGTVMGIAVLNKSKFKIISNQKLVHNDKYSDNFLAANDTTYTLTESASTPSSMVIDLKTLTYVPEGGDTYIGRSTNLLFSKGRLLGIFKRDDGTYDIGEKDGITVGQQFGTEFIFPQAYILNTLIPNWEQIIKSRLEEGYVSGNHWDDNVAVKVPGKVMYYTKYKDGDTEFGKSNGDTKVFTAEQMAAAKGYPSYRMVNGTDNANVQDEVQNAINSINQWRARIADNERDKLEAFADATMLKDNYSIASGSKISNTDEIAYRRSYSHKNDTVYTTSLDINIGGMVNDAGYYGIVHTEWNRNYYTTNDSTVTKSQAVAWTMSDSDPRTALTVDVYNSPKGWGPIFRTRGGQTANPYEGASYTRFYEEGTKLNEATMQIEKPQLKVKGSAEVTDVPVGGQAKFTLELSNQSETNDICNYILEVKERSNPQGAILTVDGNILSNGREGRSIKMKGGETVEKTLIVTQSDRSVNDYNDIQLILKSEKDPTVESETVKLRVHFVPASAHVDLSVDHTVLNKAYRDDNDGITATMYNLDRQDTGLQGLRLRYRRKGVDSWNIIQQWTSVDSLLSMGYLPMPDGSRFTQKVNFADDGLYELQAQTFGMYGVEEVTFESNIVEVTQDTHGPQLLGMISPETGQLNYQNRNAMHLRFNEVLNANAMSKSDNFRIEGGMNNVVFGESLYPDVAVQLNGERFETDAMYDLSNTNYAFDMWFYRQGDGTIISLGTDNNLLSLSTHDGGMLQARVGTEEEVYDAGVTLPENKWTYMALNYCRKSGTETQNHITMLYATADDKEPQYVGKNVPASNLYGHGKLSIGGNGMKGMVAELSVWNNDITAAELYETRNMARASYTPGLVGYWNMTEGHGTQITDMVRARHIYMPSESWYINNENRAVHLSGNEGSPLKIDIATFNPNRTDNFAYEMWFRGSEADNEGKATLMAVNTVPVVDSSQPIVQHPTSATIGFDEGKLELKLMEDNTVRSETILSDHNYLDGFWHHFALNVRRGTSTIAYVDGEAVKVLTDNAIPAISSRYLIVGGELNGDSETNRFKGDVDEIRIWSAALDGQLISDRRYERLDNSYPGLVGYFPMEEIHRTQQGTVVTDFSMQNFGEKDSRLHIDNTQQSASVAQADNAPALKPGSTKMRLDDSQFNFTASADEVYFSFPDAALPLMDNNDFVVTVNNIKDTHGNNSEPVSWKIHADFASVKWNDDSDNSHIFGKRWNDAINWTEIIVNNTGSPQSYEISGLPSWLTVDKPVGTINSDWDLVQFSVGNDVPVGRYTEYLYVTDRLGIKRVLPLTLVVSGDEPEWEVNPDLYESNMMLTGQVYIEDRISEFADTKVAAFDAAGNCRGIASPEYVDTRDAYYVNMVVYGASATELSTGEADLTFKMYDASTGRTYPIVNVTLPGKEPSTSIRYAQDAIFGNYDNPVIFSSTALLQQSISLPQGWSWMSIYVQPESNDILSVLPKAKADRKRFLNIKSHNAIASVNPSDGTVLGSLKEMSPGNMYKVQTSSSVSYNLIGSLINVRDTAATIYPGWNWMGTLSNDVMSVKDAFAELDPEPGDVVKSRTAFASYRGNGIWEGTLQNIVPGMGYIYRSMASGAKTFHYPRTTHALYAPSAARVQQAAPRTAHYNPVDNHLYPDNMNVIAVVRWQGNVCEDAELGAFVNGECRGAAVFDSGYYFLTVMGSSADDLDNEVVLRVYNQGDEYEVLHLPFASDAIYGSLEQPFEIVIDGATAIRTYSSGEADTEWYTLQGYKIGRRPTTQGVYIHQGKKVAVKAKKE